MRICKLEIKNFRGVKSTEILFKDHTVIIGDNNVGKSTIFEAIDLVLGPTRSSRRSAIDEHDFYNGRYTQLESDEVLPRIMVHLTITGLDEEQTRHFSNNLEHWHTVEKRLLTNGEIKQTDNSEVTDALRVSFQGWYDPEEDDFIAITYFTRSIDDNPDDDHNEVINKNRLSTKDKRKLPFLYLRTLRTGRRALSLEHGSLLDIILRLKEVTPKQMWEKILEQLRGVEIASDPSLGLSEVLDATGQALGRYVPSEGGTRPQLRVSNLTRDHLRQVITAFLEVGPTGYIAPYDHQGTGTVNMLVLALLSQIADSRDVVFAMEEPEIAIPPHTQKQVVDEIKRLSSQALFTSHSPYVIEEFDLEHTTVLARDNGVLQHKILTLPDNLDFKRYRREFRTHFCEALLSKRVLIVEGRTEADALPVVARHLGEKNDNYASLERLGIPTLNAEGEGNIAGLAKMLKEIGKQVFVFCDYQSEEKKSAIKAHVKYLFMHQEGGFEDLLANAATEEAKQLFMESKSQEASEFKQYLISNKGDGVAAEFLAQCSEEKVPEFIRDFCKKIKLLAESQSNESIEVDDGAN